MDEHERNLAAAAHRAAGRLPEGKGGGVQAWDAFVEVLEAELGKAGIRIVRVRKAARAPSAGD